MELEFSRMVGLVIATAVLGLSPGPAVFATLARAISMPFRRVLFFILGIVLADFFFAVIAMAGVALIVSQHRFLFVVLQVLGAGYLFYLGLSALLSKGGIREVNKSADANNFVLVGSGFLLTASNPKDLLFFVSFLPAFIDLNAAGFSEMSIASLLVAVTFTCTLCFYAVLASMAKEWFKNPKFTEYADKVSGLILIIVGVLILVSR